MAVAELCVVAKPAIFVPYPYAAEDHQTVNASVLVSKNAALMVPDANVKSGLFPCLLQLINDEQQTDELRANIAKLGNLNADELIATEIIKTISKD
jgi:UDP-N-acetylglucosamine--N-acetylmuramyl-(pentapeptide) pyrophosphoryl-undecaprenol N-acetylglucosamine transferase